MLWTDLHRYGRGFGYGRPSDVVAEQLKRMEKEMRSLFAGGQGNWSTEFPPLNILPAGEDATITAELPGLCAEDIDISIIGKSLTIKGSRKAEDLAEGEAYHRKERWYGDFARTIELPFAVNADKVTADFSQGVLYLTLPRAEEDKPKKITVKTE